MALRKLRQVALARRRCRAGMERRICSRSSAVLKVAVVARSSTGEAVMDVVEGFLVVKSCS